MVRSHTRASAARLALVGGELAPAAGGAQDHGQGELGALVQARVVPGPARQPGVLRAASRRAARACGAARSGGGGRPRPAGARARRGGRLGFSAAGQAGRRPKARPGARRAGAAGRPWSWAAGGRRGRAGWRRGCRGRPGGGRPGCGGRTPCAASWRARRATGRALPLARRHGVHYVREVMLWWTSGAPAPDFPIGSACCLTQRALSVSGVALTGLGSRSRRHVSCARDERRPPRLRLA